MAKYLDDSDSYHERRMDPRVRVSATEARQGFLGRPVLMVLVISLALVMLAWAAAEFWGTSIAPDEGIDPATTSSTADPTASKDTIDNNQPAGQKVQPAPAIQDSTKL